MHWLHFYQSRCFLQKIINTSMLRIQNKHLKKCITGEQLIQRKLRIWVKLAITLYSNVHFQWIIKHFHKILRSTTLSDIYNNIYIYNVKSCRSDWKQISVIVFVHYLSNINLFYFIFHFSFITLLTLEYIQC